MGRPSLVEVRQRELLDAIQTCILSYGVHGTTVARVAEVAAVQPSLVHHYLGSRQEMLDVAVTRVIADIETIVVDALHETPPANRLTKQLDILFGGRTATPEINQLIDQLVAASYLDEAIRFSVQRMYTRFAEILDATLTQTHPLAPPRARKQTAHAILALAHAAPTFEWLAFERHNLKFARSAAQNLIDALPEGSRP
jgi:AcrR family transcriptional regulator